MHVRRAVSADLEPLLALLAQLHPEDLPPPPDAAASVWAETIADGRTIVLIGELQGRPIATCTLVIVPNLTRGARPYGLIENVVTDARYRRQGYGSSLLRVALEHAWEIGCYKVMLLTGTKREETLRFYEHAGFRRGLKTGFVAAAPDAG